MTAAAARRPDGLRAASPREPRPAWRRGEWPPPAAAATGLPRRARPAVPGASRSWPDSRSASTGCTPPPPTAAPPAPPSSSPRPGAAAPRPLVRLPRPALLPALRPLLGHGRPRRPRRARRLVRAGARRRVRPGQPAARGRARRPHRPLPVPALLAPLPRPRPSAHRGRPRVRVRRRPATASGCDALLRERAARLRESVLRQGRADRPGRRVGAQARGPGARARACRSGPGRRAAYCDFLAEQGQALEDHATWCALAEVHGPDWHALAGRPARPALAPRPPAPGTS